MTTVTQHPVRGRPARMLLQQLPILSLTILLRSLWPHSPHLHPQWQATHYCRYQQCRQGVPDWLRWRANEFGRLSGKQHGHCCHGEFERENWLRSLADTEKRTISSSQARRMALSACTHLKHTHTKKCSLGVPCPFETLHFQQTDNGRQWLASGCKRFLRRALEADMLQ